MAKVDSPLFGMAADGQIGQSLVFARWKGTRYARRYVVPANPRSNSQLEVRGIFSFLISLWKMAPSGFRAPFVAKASGEPLTPVNAFVKSNAAYLRGETDLSSFACGVAVLGGLAPAAGSITGGAGAATVNLTAPELPAGWVITRAVGVCIEDQSPSQLFAGTVRVAEDTAAPWSVSFSGLAAGSYFAGGYFVFQRDDGRVAYGVPVGQVVAVS